ncbi:MAG: FadR/GntR family transcriptional regulator [Meiothermus sp.]|nr:FadR/GntR family transcriptional regulator [Meiothermus sp.]
MKFGRVQQIRLYEQIVERMEELAEVGQLTPGEKFPPERELMKQLGVSRQVLREAFSVMESQGWVSTTPGGGRVYLGKTGSNPAVLLKALQGSALLELLDAREAVECKIAELAAQNATPEDIRGLVERIEKLDQSGYTFEWNYDFHLAIAETARNNVLYSLLQLLLQIRREVYARDYLSKAQLKRLFQDHLSIVEAIETGEGARAREVMRKHILDTRRAYQERIAKLGTEVGQE